VEAGSRSSTALEISVRLTTAWQPFIVLRAIADEGIRAYKNAHPDYPFSGV
jgi:hypothetical protein